MGLHRIFTRWSGDDHDAPVVSEALRIIESSELPAIKQGEIPRHVGAIMDGNGRWALMRGYSRSDGHAAAEHAVVDTIDGALELGIGWLTVYAFSTENWSRDPAEVTFLMNLKEWLLHEERVEEFHSKGVRIRFVGRVDDRRVPDDTRQWISEVEAKTANNERLQFCIGFNYGGRAEIVDAVRSALAAGLTDIDEAVLQANMYVADMPDMDLVIRTSMEQRMSNFFPWHATYAELLFTETLWPDFRRWHLFSAVAEYQSRNRRMGVAVSIPG
jgi:undecaprenyl diphosphate synthase